jgi:hypothetical protein
MRTMRNYIFLVLSLSVLLSACGSSESSVASGDTASGPEMIGIQCDYRNETVGGRKSGWVTQDSKVLFDQNLGAGFSESIPTENVGDDGLYCVDIQVSPYNGAPFIMNADYKRLNSSANPAAACASFTTQNGQAFSVSTRTFTGDGSFSFDYSSGGIQWMRKIIVMNKADMTGTLSQTCDQSSREESRDDKHHR